MRTLLLASAARVFAAPDMTTGEAIPSFLKRAPETGTASAKPATPEAVKANPTETKPAATRQAKVSAPKQPKARKGKVVASAHKPADIVATEDNPQKSIVPVKFKTKYAAHGGSNGDRISLALKAATETRDANGRVSVDHAALAKIAEANGIDFSAYKKLNPGQQRMNVGNRLRGMLRNEKPVTIGKQRFADWEKAKVVAPVKQAEAA